MEPKIITVTMNPAIDKTIVIDAFQVGQLNRIKSTREDPGGKGINVSKAIATYGIRQVALGLLAGYNGKKLLNMLNQYHFQHDFTFVSGETRTNLKVLDITTRSITELNETGYLVQADDLNDFYIKLEKYLLKSEIMILSGSLPLSIPDYFYSTCIQMATRFNTRVILDADGAALREGIQAGPFAIKPNIYELERFTGKVLDTWDKIRIETVHLEKLGIKLIVISMGDQGAVFHYQGKTWHALPLPVEVKSTVGAGDAMVAALAYCIYKNLSAEDTVKISTAAGCLTAAKEGTEMAEWSEIHKVYNKVTLEEL